MSYINLLIKNNTIDQDTANVLEQKAVDLKQSLDSVLRDYGLKSADILKAKSEYLNIEPYYVGDNDIPFEVLNYIPEDSARHYKIIPIFVSNGILNVGIYDPDNIQAIDALNFIASKNNITYKLFLISEEDFNRSLSMYKGLTGEVHEALGNFEKEFGDLGDDLDSTIIKNPQVTNPDGSIPETHIIEDAPVKKIVATIIRYAIEGGVSDIHIEPLKDKVRVRYRVDGILNTSIELPKNVIEALVARIKILSEMKLDEKRKPQDGRFSARAEGRKIDFRVSTFPTYFGEKVVMRILDQDKGVQKLDSLNFQPDQLDMLKKALKRPHGLILISGPTGSGKTTTLYSMLMELDRDTQNVLSLEDPIEYNMDGISQSQVHSEIGYTFASGLRTTLRQDPDVIMVGEIRDKETAQLAIQAALTGHLVLSTIHTNTAIGIVPRLIDMGIDPYLIAPTLILGMAQRLVGKANESATEIVEVSESIKSMIAHQFLDLPDQYKKTLPEVKDIRIIKPTPECPKGIKGRVAVFEMYEMDRKLESIILTKPTENEIYDYIRKEKGMITMKEDAIIKSLQKMIPFEEIGNL
jgi:type IV pilus assembly protein PilB